MARKTETQIREVRKTTLYAAYECIVKHFKELALVPVLNKVRVEKVIDDYVHAYAAIVNRLKIDGRIQRPKIAGLMAAAILKHKPVDLCDRDHSPTHDYESTQGNELLAFWHGLCLCAEAATKAQVEALVKNPLFEKWRGDLLALFEHHPANPECFALIFETACMTYFPESLEVAQGKLIAVRSITNSVAMKSRVNHRNGSKDKRNKVR